MHLGLVLNWEYSRVTDDPSHTGLWGQRRDPPLPLLDRLSKSRVARNFGLTSKTYERMRRNTESLTVLTNDVRDGPRVGILGSRV